MVGLAWTVTYGWSVVQNTVQGETVAMPGREAIRKPHRSDVKPIKKNSDEIRRNGKPIKNCAY